MKEQVELLGTYEKIPKVLTLSAIPTSSELEYISAEDIDKILLDKILPEAIEENIDPWQLLEIDYQWITRCLRIINYGPYFTTNRIYCSACGEVSEGEYRVSLNAVECKPLPIGFKNEVKISREEFIDFNSDITLKLLTIKEAYTAKHDKAFQYSNGTHNEEMARLCYSITSFGTNTNLTPLDVKYQITKELSAADYLILKEKARELMDYGLRAGGMTTCPKCGTEGTGGFFALSDVRFFQPTVGDLKQWKHDRSQRKDEDLPSDTPRIIRANSR